MGDFRALLDLASERLGGAVLWANDEFFAPKENLIRAAAPVWKEGVYTERGKWMDGWESRRRREPGHDSCILRLGIPGVVRGVVVDTAFFTGNYPQACSIEACSLEGTRSGEQCAEDESIVWTEILPRVELEGDSENLFEVSLPRRVTHLRLHIYPDGGVARLRVHGEPMPELGRLLRRGEYDPLAAENGGRAVGSNDAHYGAAENLVMPGRGVNMGDGWETRRRRGPGHDWVVLALMNEGSPRQLEIDTLHFKGNYPDRAAIQVCHAPEASDEELMGGEVSWRTLLPECKLQAHSRHFFEVDPQQVREPVTHLRMQLFPDGGVSRLRLWGELTQAGWEALSLAQLAACDDARLEQLLRSCCGSSAWVEAMKVERPFASREQMLERAAAIWRGLDREDWMEAFEAHPKIGERKAQREVTSRSAGWSEGEQAGVEDAQASVKERLARGNAQYEERFGHIYIVCASGKSAEEMLEILESRLANEAQEELENAAEEQRKITVLRLEKLLAAGL